MQLWRATRPDSMELNNFVGKARRRAQAGWILALLLLGGSVVGGRAQVANDFVIPAETYEGVHQGQIKTKITGKQLRPAGDKRYVAKVLKIETFPETGTTNQAEITIEAPDCNFNTTNFTANSAGPLEMHSADGRLRMSGVGFQWEKHGTNSILMVSNQVHTTIQRALVAGTTGAKPATAAGTNQVLEIYSDQFIYDRGAELITYSGRVHGGDDQIELQCDLMEIHRSSTNSVERIDADQNVVIIRKGTGGRATGRHAVYTARGDEKLVELTGGPRYVDGLTEASGTVFFFDQARHTIRSVGEAYLKFPRPNSADAGGWFAAPAPKPGVTVGEVRPTDLTEIYAERMTFFMPATNGPMEQVLAETNVIILVDPARNSRASAARAVYTQASGRMELTGNAFWQADDRVLRAGRLAYNNQDQVLEARTNAYLKLPTSAFGTNRTVAGPSAGANQFIEVVADDYDYAAGLLTFRREVRAGLLTADVVRATLEAGTLQVRLTPERQISGLRADTNVYVHLLPTPDARGRSVERDFRSQHLDITMRTNNLLAAIRAEGLVQGTQNTITTNHMTPSRLGLSADSVQAQFFPTTNRVQTATAEGQVALWKDDATAFGRTLLYTGTNDLARLTGDPILHRPGVTSFQDRIIYNHALGSFILGESRRTQVRINLAAARASRTNAPAAAAGSNTTAP